MDKLTKYDYRQSLKNDIINYISENGICWGEDDMQETEDRLYEALWVEDSETGNGSGSYTFNAWKAEENLCHNLDLPGEALEEFGTSPDYLIEHGAEECDVTIRCFLLSEVLHEVMLELNEEDEI